MPEADAGVAVDLRDESTIRAVFLGMMLDWDGSDMRNIYEPISQQLGYVFSFLLTIVCVYTVWKLLKKWREERKQKFVPYRVIKPPSSVIEEAGEGGERKRTVAVVGGTGFIGSSIVDELVSRGDYYVYVLGRKFRPERTNAAADALIQVDMRDLDGLMSAFQGVDSVIDVAAAVPTVFTDVDTIWEINKHGLENLTKAAKKAGVKNFVYICGVHMEGRITDPQARVFLNSFYLGEKHVIELNGQEGMRTCVLSPCQVVGTKSPFWDMVLSGKVSSLPMVEHRATFLPVKFIAQATVNAERKLAVGNEEVVGKVHTLVGQPSSFREFFSLPQWPRKMTNCPLWLVRGMAKLNSFLAKTTSRAPFGADLAPAITEFFAISEEEVDSSAVFELLEVGPAPPIEEIVEKLVEKYREMESKKTN